MSSSPTALVSTTHSSISSSSLPDRAAATIAVIACGALAGHIRAIARRLALPVEVCALPAVLHNRPDQIAPAAAALAESLRGRGLLVALGYADCGSYGALDELCDKMGLRRLRGLHCYDVLGGASRVRQLLAREPGTYLLTDYLVRSFDRTVLAGLGLDRYPELWPDYFGHYRRLVWLAQERDAALDQQAAAIAARFGLPLRIIDTGTGGLERELVALVALAGADGAAGANAPAGAGAAATDAAGRADDERVTV